MAVKIYSYKKCSTCRKGLAFLTKRKVLYTEVDITETPPTKSELKAMLAHYGGQLKKLFNTSGQAYRALGLGAKLDDMSESEALALLAKDGKLVKRPFIIDDGKPVAVGFDEKIWAAELGS